MNNPQNQKKLITTNPLVILLESRQKEMDRNDAEFARLLGISRPLWWMTRNGQRVVNVTLLRGVARAFPDLDVHILAFLRSEN